MGEENAAELDPLPQLQPQPQSEYQENPATVQSQTQTDDLTATATAATTTELNNAAPAITSPPLKTPLRPRKSRKQSTNVPNPNSPPRKIPIRPRKTRKLSSNVPNPNSSPQIDSTTETANVSIKPPKTTPKLTKAQRRAAEPRTIGRSLSCEGEVEAAIRHLRNADPILSGLIDMYNPPTFETFQSPFLALTRSILYQYFKAGKSIYSRFFSVCGGESGVVPETILALTSQELRQIGVSGSKASYLPDLARKYQNGILSDSIIVNMDDKNIFTMLTMVNGIGSWSVHLFMIFSLHRPDVLPIYDLVIRKGVQLLYELEELPKPSQMDQLCEKWRPYRSVASCYLWRFVESHRTPSSAAVATGDSMPLPQEEPQIIAPIDIVSGTEIGDSNKDRNQNTPSRTSFCESDLLLAEGGISLN